MPSGLRQADRLPEPVFTPSTKEESGHDINITFEQLQDLIGAEPAGQVRQASLALYTAAAAYAEERGIILADTKFEFGMVDGRLTVADEIFTPDSSRFWELSDYEPGRPQKSFDKQYLREWLETLDWNKTPPPPTLPPAVIEATSIKYIEAYERLTGKKLL
jgi:phosphoribosylaminoimidazole-succinocarboxamide synthase